MEVQTIMIAQFQARNLQTCPVKLQSHVTITASAVTVAVDHVAGKGLVLSHLHLPWAQLAQEW